MSQLPLLGVDPDGEVHLEQLIKGFIGFDIGHETVVGRFADGRLFIAKIFDHLFEQLAPDIILNLPGVQVNNLKRQGTRKQVDIFLVHNRKVP